MPSNILSNNRFTPSAYYTYSNYIIMGRYRYNLSSYQWAIRLLWYMYFNYLFNFILRWRDFLIDIVWQSYVVVIEYKSEIRCRLIMIYNHLSKQETSPHIILCTLAAYVLYDIILFYNFLYSTYFIGKQYTVPSNLVNTKSYDASNFFPVLIGWLEFPVIVFILGQPELFVRSLRLRANQIRLYYNL